MIGKSVRQNAFPLARSIATTTTKTTTATTKRRRRHASSPLVRAVATPEATHAADVSFYLIKFENKKQLFRFSFSTDAMATVCDSLGFTLGRLGSKGKVKIDPFWSSVVA